MYYENFILINIEISNFEEIKKYFDNEENKIVLLNDNYSIQSLFEHFTPVMYSDREGSFSQWAKYLIGGVFILAGKTWGSKAFLAAVESFGKQQTNRTLQQVMYMSLDKTITLHTAQAFAKVSLAVAASTILGDVL